VENETRPTDESRTCTLLQLAGLINLLHAWQEFWTRDQSVGRPFTYKGERKTEKYTHRAGVGPGMPFSDFPKTTGILNCTFIVIGTFIILLEIT
jgi:hypothetical protein